MKKIKYLVMDVDGTLTDGKIYMGDRGELMKAFNIKDGYGIKKIALSQGIIPVIITGRSSTILENRCKELGIELCYQGIENKVEKMGLITADMSEIAYIGDDINDFLCMQAVKMAGGIVGCPSDAVGQIIEISDFVSCKKGGSGAVREFIDWIIAKSI